MSIGSGPSPLPMDDPEGNCGAGEMRAKVNVDELDGLPGRTCESNQRKGISIDKLIEKLSGLKYANH